MIRRVGCSIESMAEMTADGKAVLKAEKSVTHSAAQRVVSMAEQSAAWWAVYWAVQLADLSVEWKDNQWVVSLVSRTDENWAELLDGHLAEP